MLPPKNLEDLERIVEERLEETVRLELKRELPPSGKNDDLATDMSAMANTEGGVIVYGIEEDDTGRANALCPFPISGAAERVNLVARNSLNESLALGAVYSIPAEDATSLGFLVVEVPRSERAPHFFQGTAWGRTSKGNVRLTRRRVGELFAQSAGFAEEFGLIVGRPGRVFAEHAVERYQTTDMYGHPQSVECDYLIFKNDGDSDCFDVKWEWLPDEPGAETPSVLEDPFPLEVLQSGVRVRLRLATAWGTRPNLRVVSRWRDKNGQQHEQVWPITW